MALLAVAFLSWLRRLGFFAACRAALLDLVIVILSYQIAASPCPAPCSYSAATEEALGLLVCSCAVSWAIAASDFFDAAGRAPALPNFNGRWA